VDDERKPGRPRKWSSDAERMRAYRDRQRDRSARRVDPAEAPEALIENRKLGERVVQLEDERIGSGRRSFDCRPNSELLRSSQRHLSQVAGRATFQRRGQSVVDESARRHAENVDRSVPDWERQRGWPPIGIGGRDRWSAVRGSRPDDAIDLGHEVDPRTIWARLIEPLGLVRLEPMKELAKTTEQRWHRSGPEEVVPAKCSVFALH
jgi:hypothetical protein